MSLTNLLQETLEDLTSNSRSVDEVFWVGTDKLVSTWAQFAELAKDINYDAGYGGAEINDNLVVVGFDWWLERHEYDGAEWWEFKTLPTSDADRSLTVTDIRDED